MLKSRGIFHKDTFERIFFKTLPHELFSTFLKKPHLYQNPYYLQLFNLVCEIGGISSHLLCDVSPADSKITYGQRLYLI